MENSELDEAAFQNLAAGDRGAFLPLADATSDIQQAYASIGLRDDPTDPASRRIARVVTLDMVHYDTATAGDEVYLPNVLGGFGAWQFCVPNFSKEFIDPSSVVNIRSTDRDQLAAHFGLTAAELDSLVKIGERMRP